MNQQSESYSKKVTGPSIFAKLLIRVSQIAGVLQKMIFESCTLYHIMPFAKIIGPEEKKITKS